MSNISRDIVGDEILLAKVIVKIISFRNFREKRLDIEVEEQNRQKHCVVEILPENNITALLPLVVQTAISKLTHTIEKSHKS